MRKLADELGVSVPRLLVESALRTEAGSDVFRRDAVVVLLQVVDEIDEVTSWVGEVSDLARDRLLALTGDGSALVGLVERLGMPDGRSRRR